MTREMHSGLATDRHVLVIGGAGYIGSVLAHMLVMNGYRVRVLDQLVYTNGSSLVHLLDEPGFSFLQGDLCERATLAGALHGVTDVVLLAALVGDPICKKYPDAARRINQAGAIQVAETLRGRGIRNFIFTSTCSNYGLRTSDEFATEEAELNPQSLYAETKVAVEHHLLEHRASFDYCPTILRLSTAYGLSRRMRFDLTISEFCRDLTLGKDLLVYDEHTWRPYCHVADISDVILRVLNSPQERVRGEIFNVGSNDQNYTKKMIVDVIAQHLERVNVQYGKGGADPRNYRVAFDKVRQVLGFTNRFSVESSVAGLISAIRNGVFADVEDRKTFYGNYVVHGIA